MAGRVALIVTVCIGLPLIIGQPLGAQAPAVEAPSFVGPGFGRPALRNVIVLEPVVEFESLNVRPESRRANVDASAFAQRLLEAARSQAETANLGVVLPEGCAELVGAEDCQQLRQLTSRLVRGHFTQAATGVLGRVESAAPDAAVLVQFMRIKEGPGGSWNPMSGAIASSMSTTLLQAAVVAGATGEIRWSAEVLVRKAFGASSGDFKRSVAQLYQTFRIK